MNKQDLINLICGVSSMIVYLSLCLMIQLGGFSYRGDILYPAALAVSIGFFYALIISATRYHYE